VYIGAQWGPFGSLNDSLQKPLFLPSEVNGRLIEEPVGRIKEIPRKKNKGLIPNLIKE